MVFTLIKTRKTDIKKAPLRPSKQDNNSKKRNMTQSLEHQILYLGIDIPLKGISESKDYWLPFAVARDFKGFN